jgi:hypothetical protein
MSGCSGADQLALRCQRGPSQEQIALSTTPQAPCAPRANQRPRRSPPAARSAAALRRDEAALERTVDFVWDLDESGAAGCLIEWTCAHPAKVGASGGQRLTQQAQATVDLGQVDDAIAENQACLGLLSEMVSAQRMHLDLVPVKIVDDAIKIDGCAGERRHVHAVKGRERLQPLSE